MDRVQRTELPRSLLYVSPWVCYDDSNLGNDGVPLSVYRLFNNCIVFFSSCSYQRDGNPFYKM